MSRPIAIQPDLTYQTGVQIIINSNYASTVYQAFTVPYVSVMSTASLNGSLGIMDVKYYMVSNVFGWRMYIASLTSSVLTIHISVLNPSSSLYLLRVCYFISSNPDLDMGYVEYTYNRINLTIQQ